MSEELQPNETIKVVEDVDKLFSQIVVNGVTHNSDRYVPPVPRATPIAQQFTEPEPSQPAQTEPTQGQYVKAVELNHVLHDLKDEPLNVQVEQLQAILTAVSTRLAEINTMIPEEASLQNQLADKAFVDDTVDSAIEALDVGNIGGAGKYITTIRQADGKVIAYAEDVASSVTEGDSNPVSSDAVNTAIEQVNSDIDGIEELIPNQASAQNQLADKAFVNSSVSTNTANYINNNGLPFNSLAELEVYSGTVTNNDYAFVTGTDSAGNTYYDRYKATVVGSTVTWALEYRLNNSSFTAEQWATINSGLTQSSVASAIEDAIALLDVASVGGTGKYIESISEVDGKIVPVEKDLTSFVSDEIDSAIEDLDVASVGGTGKYIESISEADGKIVPVEKNLATTIASGNNNPVTSDAVYQAIQGAGITTVDVVQSGNMSAVTSNAVANYKPANATYADSAGRATRADEANKAVSADRAGFLLIEGTTDNGHFRWSGNSGQPTWLWGSNDGVNMYVWNPANFYVAHASSAGSSGGGTLYDAYGLSQPLGEYSYTINNGLLIFVAWITTGQSLPFNLPCAIIDRYWAGSIQVEQSTNPRTKGVTTGQMQCGIIIGGVV